MSFEGKPGFQQYVGTSFRQKDQRSKGKSTEIRIKTGGDMTSLGGARQNPPCMGSAAPASGWEKGEHFRPQHLLLCVRVAGWDTLQCIAG